jgi:predicted O-methyltransferase YrrM
MAQASVESEAISGIRAARDAIFASGQVPGLHRGSFAAFPSGLTQKPGELLRRLVAQTGGTKSIETGFALGISTLFILEGLLEHDEARAQHVAVDPYQSKDWCNAGVRTVRDAGAQRFVRVVEQDSAIALPAMVAGGEQFDFGFVDGGHHFEHAFLDTYFMLRLVRPGGFVVIDDVWMPAVRAAVSYITKNLGVAEISDNAWDPAAAKRFAVLRVPGHLPERSWDHFVPF